MTNHDHDHDDIHPPTFDPDDPNPLGPRPPWMSLIPTDFTGAVMDIPDVSIPVEAIQRVVFPEVTEPTKIPDIVMPVDDEGVPFPGFVEFMTSTEDSAWWQPGPYEGGDVGMK